MIKKITGCGLSIFWGGVIAFGYSGVMLEKTGGDYTIVFTYLGVMALIGVILMALIKVVKIRK